MISILHDIGSIQARRIDSDYGDYVEIGVDEASDSLRRAEEFVKKAEEVLDGLKKLDAIQKIHKEY
ncbi:MAG: hypothetical protein OHK0032_19150 [Thermodesulfovibrionales bacterium]